MILTAIEQGIVDKGRTPKHGRKKGNTRLWSESSKSRLKKVKAVQEAKREETKTLHVSLLVLMFTLLVFSIASSVGVGGYLLLSAKPDTPTPQIEETTTTVPQVLAVVTTSTSTTSSTTTTTTSTTTTSTTSTTTTLCGGKFQKPCEKGGCEDGLVLDSQGTCQTTQCAPSKSSGRDGCGSFALSFCRGQA